MIYVFIHIYIYVYIYVIDRKINRLCWENSQLLAVDLGNSQYFQIGIFGPCSEHFHYSSSTIKPCSHPLWNWGIWGIRQARGAFTSLCNPLYNLCHKISPDAFHVPILRHYASRKKRGKALECSEGVNWCPLCQVCHDDTLDTLHTCL